jgi:ABC-type transport system involved in multi-copper enzyme maturation permease subunit
MRASLEIAAVTARGLLERRVVVLFLVLAAALVAARFGLASGEAEQLRVAGDSALAAAAYSQAGMAMFESAVLVASLVGAVLGLYAFTTDRRQRSIVTILCRPVHRFDYAIGKALGVVGPIAGTVIVIGGLLVAGLGILGAGIPNQLWLGLLQVTAKVTCWVCLAVAIGLHLRPGIAILCAMAASVLPGLRNGPSSLGRSIGATVHALLPAEAPIDFAKQAFSYEVIDVDLGLHLSVVAENVLYGIGALAVSAALFARRDLDLAD